MKALVNDSGKVLIGSDRKVATDDCPSTCCGGFSCGACGAFNEDSFFCPHLICFNFTVDQSEVDGGGNGDFVDIELENNDIYGVYADYADHKWRAYSPNGDSFVNMASGSPAGKSHAAQLTLTSNDGENLTLQLCVDGVFSSSWTETKPEDCADTLNIANIYAGSKFNTTPCHRSITNLTFLANLTGGTFAFPAEAFDTFGGDPYPTLIEDGTVLRVDIESGESFAAKAVGIRDAFCRPVISLVCDQISASITKCGFTAFHGSRCLEPHTDFGYGTTINFPGDLAGASCRGELFDCGSVSGDSDTSKFYQTRTVTISGRSNTGAFGGCSDNADTCGTQIITSTSSLSTCLISDEFDPSTNDGIARCDTNPFTGDYPVTAIGVLTDEVTTDDLIAAAALPDYDDDFDDICQASTALSEDETSYSIERFKPKFTFAAARAAFTINYNEHFNPDVGDTVDTPRTLLVSKADEEAIGLEVLEPESNGVITITDVCVTDISF